MKEIRVLEKILRSLQKKFYYMVVAIKKSHKIWMFFQSKVLWEN